jgi:histone H2A
MADVEEAPAKREVVSKSTRAGLLFPTGRIEKKLRKAAIADRCGTDPSIFMTGVVESVIETVLRLANEQASSAKPAAKRLTNAHVVAAARSDPDLARVFSGFCFSTSNDAPKAVEHILDAEDQKTRKEDKVRKAAEKETENANQAPLND